MTRLIPAFAKKVGVPVAVAQEFNAADAGKTPPRKGKKRGPPPQFARKMVVR